MTGATSILSFSTGKDSVGAWLAIRDHFDSVVPYYLYLVPGLSFVEESLAYFERVMGRHIIRLPHPSFYRWLNNFTFQPPDRAAVIAAARLPDFEYLDIHRIVCEREGLDLGTMIASGVRAADSPMRRLQFSTHGAISPAQKQYYPVWDWDKARLLAEIERADIKLPADYELFGRTFDGLDLRFLYPLKHKRPADYRKILEWFPLAEMEIWRYEKARKAG